MAIGAAAEQRRHHSPLAHNWVRRFTPIAAGIWLALALFPGLPTPLGTGLDPSWVYALNLAHRDGLRFGADVLFTYGPLGFLLHPDASATSPGIYFLFAFAAYGLLLASFVMLFRALPSRAWALFGCVTLACFDLFGQSDTAPAVVPLIGFFAVLVARPAGAPLAAILASVCIAFLLLAKCSIGVVAYISLCLLLAFGKRHWLERSAVLLAPVLFLAGLLANTHSWRAIGGYLHGTLELTSGYNAVMSTPGPRWQVALAALATLFLFAAIPRLARGRRSLGLGLVAAAPLAFLFFKLAMVREDRHASPFHIALAVVALLILSAASKSRDRAIVGGFCAASLVLGLVILHAQVPGAISAGARRLSLQQTFASIGSGFLHPRQYWGETEAATERNLAPLRVGHAAAQLLGSGAVDVIPNAQDYVRANHWRWRPHPVFQSYSAYTPYLDRLNASYFESPRAAPHLLFAWNFIDGRLPFVSDARTWRSLINWYGIVLVRPQFLVLQRRTSPRYGAPHRIGSTVARWNEPVRIPQSGSGDLILMRARITPSMLGRLKAFFLRTVSVYIEARSDSGRNVRARVVWRNLAEGAIVTTLPASLAEMTPYFSGPSPEFHDHIRSLRFVSAQPVEFSSAIPIVWEEMSPASEAP